MANIIDSLKFGSAQGVFTLPYAECSTAAGTAAKVATATNFALEAGARIAVKFTNANTAGTPTLNINGSGAKNIYHKGVQITDGGNKALLAGALEFVYDGTQYHLIGNYIDTNTDTKNTAGSTDTSSKIYLVGAMSQAANPQTYSHDTVYVGTDGHLYSNSKQVVNLGDAQEITGAKTFSASNTFTNETRFLNNNSQYAGAPKTFYDIATGLLKAGCFTRTAADALITGQILAPNNLPEGMNSNGYNTAKDTIKFQKIAGVEGAAPQTSDLAVLSSSGLEIAGSSLKLGGTKVPTIKHTHNVTHTPAGTISANTSTTSVAGSTHTHKVTAGGTISQPTFTGAECTTSSPSGTTTVYSITGVGALPSLSSTVADECLTVSFNVGSLPTRSSLVVASSTHTHTLTPAGTVSKPTFTGAAVDSGTPSATAAVASSSHAHTFTGTSATLITGETA